MAYLMAQQKDFYRQLSLQTRLTVMRISLRLARSLPNDRATYMYFK